MQRSVGTSNPVTVIGSQSELEAARKALGAAGRALFYSLEMAHALSDEADYANEVIDVAMQSRHLESVAWAWSTELVKTLALKAEWLSQDVLHVTRRQVFMYELMPIAAARAAAAEVRRRCPEATAVRFCGLSDLEAIALGEQFAEASSCRTSAPAGRTDPIRGRLGLRRAHRMMKSLVSASLSSFQRLLRVRAMRTSLHNARRRSQGVPCAVVLGYGVTYSRLLGSTLSELRSRGWQLVALQVSPRADSGQMADQEFDAMVALALAIPTGTVEQLFSRRIRREALCNVIRDWAKEEGLERYSGRLISGFETHYWRAQGIRTAHQAVIGAVRPDVVICVNETDALTESVVPASRPFDVKSVNVQHGTFGDTLRRAEFGFDAFCVFGDGYADMLESLGTSRESIHVVGNPYLDDRSRDIGDVVPSGEPDGLWSEADEPASVRILFAAQHSRNVLSDYLLYRTLNVVLEWMESQPTVALVVKLHPLGDGAELGYEVALREHPLLQPVVTRTGDLHSLLVGCDCVVTHSSTVSMEAASFAKPVIIISSDPASDAAPPVAEGVGFRVSDVLEFGRVVEEIRSGAATTAEGYAAFEARYAFRRDSMAGSRIADLCEDLVRGPAL